MYELKENIYHYNSYIEYERFYMAKILDICYRILGSSFENRDTIYIGGGSDHIVTFFNSDVSMYELILDYLKDLDISYHGECKN